MQEAIADPNAGGLLWVGSGEENKTRVKVHSTGFKRGPEQWWFFEARGVKVCFTPPGEDGRSKYEVACAGEAFLLRSVPELLAMVHSWMKSLGLRSMLGQALRRIDLAWDLFAVTMADFADLWANRVTLARGDARIHCPDGEQLGSFYLGHIRKIQCNVYDKLAKIEDDLRSNPEKAFATLNKHCGQEVPESWTRCEFRWSGSSLREKLGTNDLQEVLKRLGEVAHYSVHNFLRFADGPVDRENRNQSKAKTHPIWEGVQSVALSDLNAKPLSKLTPEQVEMAKEYRVKRAATMLSSAAVATYRHNADGDALGAYYETLERAIAAALSRMPPELLAAVAAKMEASEAWPLEEWDGPYRRVPLPEVVDLVAAVMRREGCVPPEVPF